MSGREIRLHHLVGRMVRDADGQKVGRIQELCAEIELHEHGNEYVVRDFHVGEYGAIEALAGSRLARQLARALRLGSEEQYTISWEQMDLSDPENPRTTVSKSQLRE
jgi:sporulation protein YlmC with PRC-barrel domain